MTPRDSQAGVHTGLCWYGIQKFPLLLEAFTQEIPGVKAAEDIEYIHRMRVASRRLRAALPLFRTCFPKKQYTKWMREITKITRALGEARDTDVQIAFLYKLHKKIRKESGAHKDGETAERTSEGPAIRFLLNDLQKKRGLLQKHVLSALSALEKSGTADEMRLTFPVVSAEFRAVRKRPPLHGIPPVAALRISRRLFTLLSFGPWVLHPEAVAEHHATRIAAKKLRYTMEIFGAIYRNNLKKPLARVKKIQEILGDIHDCDVWIDHVTLILLKERTLLRSYKGTKRPDTAILSSLKVFLHEREAERKRHYRRFVHYWQVLAREGLWDGLNKTLDTDRKTRFLPPPVYSDQETLAAVGLLAAQTPDFLPHSRHVTVLSLMLFDSLQLLHGMGGRDRFLLECASLLHDIGWKDGQSGHNKRGAKIVFSDETLPFDLAERGIIGFAILSHRGRVDTPSDPYFIFLSEENQKRALIIAAMLRISDGLDYLHTRSVREIQCKSLGGDVTCNVTGTGDITAEKERARTKGDLFTRVFNRTLVIQ